jgi:hypothetical protein
MPLNTPFTIGPFLVDGEGRLWPRAQDTFPAFTFRWRGRSVHVHMAQTDPQDGRLTLQATLGRVPSTAGSDTAEIRLQSFALLHAVKRELPASWQLRLQADHSALLEAETAIPLPITAIGLVSELTRFLLELAPYLDLLDDAGVTGSSPSPGMAST